MLESLKARARRLQTDTYALYLACGDPAMPWYAKALAGLVVAYTVCPIDLIPDFIPVLGYLDDLIIVPAGIGLAFRMAPPAVISRARQEADKASAEGKINTRAGIVIVLVVWMIILAAASLLIAKAFRK